MEHRCSQRTSANLKLLIYRKTLPVALGKLKNISHSGLFVLTDYADIAVNQTLEIEFLSPSAQHIGSARFRSVVVHKAHNGLGLEIDDREYRGYKALLKQVEEARIDAPERGRPLSGQRADAGMELAHTT